MNYQISIIIPTYNEADNIGEVLQQLIAVSDVEIIVVDGESSDRTPRIISEYINSYPINLISTNPGRATQMNLGAKAASGDILLFLHADSRLPDNFCTLVIQTLDQDQVIAGAFELEIKGNLRGLWLVEKFINWRSHFLQLPYGDQAIFLRAKTFWDLGGFPELPIMEDFQFIRQVKKLGRVAIAPAKVTTSARRWQKLGVWQTTLINQLVILAFFWGVSPEKIANFYRRK